MGKFDPATVLMDGTVAPVQSPGPAWIGQMPAETIDAPGTIAANGTAGAGTITLGPFEVGGLSHLAGSVQMTTAGTLIVNRYLLADGTLPIAAGTTVAITANTLALFDINDGKVFQSFSETIINAGTAAGTLSNVNIIVASRVG